LYLLPSDRVFSAQKLRIVTIEAKVVTGIEDPLDDVLWQARRITGQSKAFATEVDL
jgi:hypothetical protein